MENPINDEETYRLRQAKERHEQMRRKFWCEAYIVGVESRYGAQQIADVALFNFDEKFPNPIGTD